MITLEANGLLRFVTPDGVVHRDLSDDQVVRLAAKWAKATAARRTVDDIAALRATQTPAACSWKCASCGSTNAQSRRPRMGRSGTCRDPFHTPVVEAPGGADLATSAPEGAGPVATTPTVSRAG